MKITFLGTGAADWQTPTESGEYRRKTSTLFDGRLLIDGTASIEDSLPILRNVEAMLFTHSHDDHYDAEMLQKIAPRKVFCERSWAKEAGALPVDAGRPFSAAGYEILPVKSNHSTNRADEQTLGYILNANGKRVFYSTDGAWITNSAYHALKDGAPLDAAIFDGTIGDDFPDDWRVFEHNSLCMVRSMRESLTKMGVLRPNAKVVVTHLARTLHPSQAELEARESEREKPLIVARDGMTIEI